MGVKKSKPNFLSIAVLGLLLVLTLPVTAFGDKRRGRNRDWDRRDRKCGKFVNCHDARDGRWDSRRRRRGLDNNWRAIRRDRLRNYWEHRHGQDRLNRDIWRQGRFQKRLNRRNV